MAITVSGVYARLMRDALGDGVAVKLERRDGGVTAYTPGDIKTMLVTNALTPFFRIDLSGQSSAYINNQVSGTGYTLGGANFPESYVSNGQQDRPPDGIQPFFSFSVYVFGSTPNPWVEWTNATISNARAAVTWVPQSASGYLACLHDFGADYSVSNGTFRVHWVDFALWRYWTNGSP